MHQQLVSTFMTDGFNLNDFHRVVHIVENSKSIISQFPLGYLVGPQRLSIACFYIRLVLKLRVDLVKNIFLLELSERLQIVASFWSVFDFIHLCAGKKIHVDTRFPRASRLQPLPVINAIASARVRGSLRKPPSTADVTVIAPDFFTPRRVMHVCSASTTTITPSGFSRSKSVFAISEVSRS